MLRIQLEDPGYWSVWGQENENTDLIVGYIEAFGEALCFRSAEENSHYYFSLPDLNQLAAFLTPEPPKCTWEQDDCDVWNTQCNNMFVIHDGLPSENDFKFCSYCGKPLVEIPYQEPPMEDEI